MDNGLWCLDDVAEGKHCKLIAAVVACILQRAANGWTTRVVKVKSHSGITGNEEADRLACQAADEPLLNNRIVDIGGAFDDLIWPLVDAPTTPAQPENEGADDSVEPPHTPSNEKWLASNLNIALKNSARARLQTGMTNETQYVQIWKDIRGALDLKASNAFWHNKAISHPAIRQTLRARYGVLHHMGQAFKMRRPYLPGLPVARSKRCPCCDQEDSTTHILNACEHPEMKAMYIERHNAAGRMILKALLTSGLGNNHIVADLGSGEKMRGLGAFDTRVNRLVSDQDMNVLGIDHNIRDKWRPDIAIKCDSHSHAVAGKKRLRRRYAKLVHVVEVGYTAESRYHDKEQEKRQQHSAFIKALTDLGHDVQLHTIILGSTGGLFTDTTATLENLRIGKQQISYLKSKLHVHSVKWLHAIVKKRRQLEANILFLAQRAKKPPDI